MMMSHTLSIFIMVSCTIFQIIFRDLFSEKEGILKKTVWTDINGDDDDK